MGPQELAQLLAFIVMAPVAPLATTWMLGAALCLTGLPLLAGIVGFVVWLLERGVSHGVQDAAASTR